MRFVNGRARDQAAQIAPVHVAGGIVIGIKQISVLWDLGAIGHQPFLQNERFEKPGCMGEVPFRRADVGHRLHDAIFRREALAKSRSEIPNLVETCEKLLRARPNSARMRGRSRSLVDRRGCG